MKTLQQILRQVDKEELIDLFVQIHPPVYAAREKMDFTSGRILAVYRSRVESLIDKLACIEPVVDERYGRCFLYASRTIGPDTFDEPCFSMVTEKDLMKAGTDCFSTSYIFTPHEEVAGFYVSGAPYTQSFMMDLLVDVLFEASWFGFDQEYMQEEEEKLNETAKRVDEAIEHGKEFENAADFIESISKAFGLVEESTEEKVLHKRVMDAAIEYCACSKRNELVLLMKEAGIEDGR